MFRWNNVKKDDSCAPSMALSGGSIWAAARIRFPGISKAVCSIDRMYVENHLQLSARHLKHCLISSRSSIRMFLRVQGRSVVHSRYPVCVTKAFH